MYMFSEVLQNAIVLSLCRKNSLALYSYDKGNFLSVETFALQKMNTIWIKEEKSKLSRRVMSFTKKAFKI